MPACSGNRVHILCLLLPRTSCPLPKSLVLGNMEEKELPSVTKLQCYCLFIFLLTECVDKTGRGAEQRQICHCPVFCCLLLFQLIASVI